ncbi:thermonuclease family protein [Desulfosediminicola ganghwensis]|uniref:thermonuclease family protein n=1 Tax=Desulfosediminicola ganghwensis TaxID=2569540 RepID=UPI0010AB8C4A|nr:thermonuclease family protein [Desulfosediminicola ganghwensis]
METNTGNPTDRPSKPIKIAFLFNYRCLRDREALLSLLLVFSLLFISSTSLAQAIIKGKVVNVADGDTITVLDSSYRQHKIRLYGIDTPEKGQAFGNSAKKFTAGLVAGKQVEVKAYDVDRYGRTVGVVMVAGLNVNRELIKAGYAWQYRKYCKASFCGDWLQLEREARVSMRGLWDFAVDPVPPWEWRKAKRSGNTSSKTSNTYTAPASEAYHGNVKSHVFHAPSCRHYECKNCVQSFGSRQEALDSGYRPCGMCRP